MISRSLLLALACCAGVSTSLAEAAATPADTPGEAAPAREDPRISGFLDQLLHDRPEEAAAMLNREVAWTRLAAPRCLPYDWRADPCLDFFRLGDALYPDRLCVFSVLPDPLPGIVAAQVKLAGALGEKLPEPKDPTVTTVVRTAEKVSDPALQLLLLQRANNLDLARGAVAKILADPFSPPPATILAACWLVKEGAQPVQAYQVLARLLASPAAGPWLSWIDPMLLSIALLPGVNEVERRPLLEACSRLVSQAGTTDRDSRCSSSLQWSMETLEIPGAPVRKPAPPPPPAALPPVPPSFYFNGRRVGMPVIPSPAYSKPPASIRTFTTTFEAMIAGGERGKVTAMLVEALRKAIGGPPEYELLTTARSIERACREALRLSLQDDLLKALEPGPTDTREDRRLRALVVWKLWQQGKRDLPEEFAAALTSLRSVHAEMPADADVAMAFFEAIGDAEITAWIARLARGDLSPAEASGLYLYASYSGRGSEKMNPQLRSPEVTAGISTILERLPPSAEAGTDFQWAIDQARDVFSPGPWQGVRLGRLGKPDPVGDLHVEIPPTKKATQDSRNQVAKRLCRAMLRHPQLSTFGYGMLSAGRRQLGIAPQELREDLAAVLKTQLLYCATCDFSGYRAFGEPQLALDLSHAGHARTFGVSPPRNGDLPATDLSRCAGAGVLPSVLTSENLAAFHALPGPDGELLRRLLDITASPGAETLSGWWQEGAADPVKRGRDLQTLLLLVTLSRREDLFRSLEDLAVEETVKPVEDPGQERAKLLAALIYRHQPLEESEETLQRIALGILGPEEFWPLYRKLRSADRWTGSGRTNALEAVLGALRHSRQGELIADRFVTRNHFDGFLRFPTIDR